MSDTRRRLDDAGWTTTTHDDGTVEAHDEHSATTLLVGPRATRAWIDDGHGQLAWTDEGDTAPTPSEADWYLARAAEADDDAE
jgi:hypothetical protein